MMVSTNIRRNMEEDMWREIVRGHLSTLLWRSQVSEAVQNKFHLSILFIVRQCVSRLPEQELIEHTFTLCWSGGNDIEGTNGNIPGNVRPHP